MNSNPAHPSNQPNHPDHPNHHDQSDHTQHSGGFNLMASAHASMIEHGFQPDFPAGTDQELAAINSEPAPEPTSGIQDLRGLLWSSVDNDTSKDLDQIEWAERL